MDNIGSVVFESMLKEAVIANFQDKIEALPSEEQLRKEFPPSPEHVRKMKKLFRYERRCNFAKKALPITKAAAVVLCVATSMFFAVLMFNSEIRAAVRGAIVEFFEGYARIEFTESPNSDKMVSEYVLSYIADGYNQVSVEEYGENILTVYEDSDENLLIFGIGPADTFASDTDYRDYREEVHEEVIYHIFESRNEDYSTIAWVQDGFMFELTGAISVSELLKMALSLE